MDFQDLQDFKVLVSQGFGAPGFQRLKAPEFHGFMVSEFQGFHGF